MIQIDMPMPACCYDCPCSCLIKAGQYAGEYICQVMEYQGVELCRTIVDGYKKTDDCPMTEVDVDE